VFRFPVQATAFFLLHYSPLPPTCLHSVHKYNFTFVFIIFILLFSVTVIVVVP